MVRWLDLISPVPRHCGTIPFERGVINPWRVLQDFELFLVSEGDAEFVVETERVICPGPYFLIMRPGLRHISRCLTPRVLIGWAHFDWMAGGGIPAGFPGELLHGPLRDHRPLELHQRLGELFNYGDPRRRRISRGVLLQELLELLEEPGPNLFPEGHEAAIAYRFRDALDNLVRRPAAEVNLMSAAKALGSSYFHQERCFRATFGVSPGQYLQSLRLERGKDLLRETALTVAEVADRVGYDDPAYFSRLFARKVGRSPRAYRKGQ